jgi:hypothetical protein
MTAIGGFLPLEVAAAGEPYHRTAVGMASGRACWHAILLAERPARVRLPFYVCDAVLKALWATRTPFEFYAIDGTFRPASRCEPLAGELMLVVNYFGVLKSFVEACADLHPDRVVVDDTQAFFRRGRNDVWSFNSARKFFGVPDGAFLYGRHAGLDGLPPSDISDCEHLLTRLSGDDGHAWDQFKEHEARVGIEPRAISAISTRLLGGVDMAGARRRRQSNFETLHAKLGPLNTLEARLDGISGDAPMCYPFLPGSDVDRRALVRLGVFVPSLWPEIECRSQPGFEWERLVARRLLPLPIDHRYGPREMEQVCQALLQVLS